MTLNNPKLIFVMAEEVSANADGIEFFIKRGIDNPSSNTTVGFLLKTSYLDIVFD